MSPMVASPSPTQQKWMETHRCVICNGLPSTVTTEMVEEHRQLKPAYRYLAELCVTPESWQTDHVGSTRSVVVVCENGHEFHATYTEFRP